MTGYADLLLQADNLKAQLDALSPMKEADEDRLWRKLRLEWNWNSNHIEGNTLTYGETELLLIFEKTTGDHDVREFDEMRAHAAAVELIRQWAEHPERELTEVDIRELNRLILVRPFWKEAQTLDGQPTRRLIQVGEYKQFPNHVLLPNEEIFYYAEPQEVPVKMQELMQWYRQETGDLHPLEVAALLHYRFVRIHPFDDGNGRIARLLANYHLLRSGFPPVVIKSADNKAYLDALNKADTGDMGSFVAYFAQQVLWSLDLAIRAAKGESVEEQEDWKKKLDLLKKGNPEDQNVQEKTDQLIRERLTDSIIPLFKRLEEDLQIFDGLFAKKEVKPSFHGTGEIPPNLTLDALTRFEFLDRQQVQTSIQKIYLSFGWKGFKKAGENAFDVYASIEVTLEDPFKYKVVALDSKKPIVKLYTQVLSDEEQKVIANSMGKFVMDQIELNRNKS